MTSTDRIRDEWFPVARATDVGHDRDPSNIAATVEEES